MAIRLGIYTGFAVNRYPEPEEWAKTISAMGVKYVQLTASLVNPSMPDSLIKHQIAKINESCASEGITILHTFTDSYTQLNHLAHPDSEIRRYWLRWFIKFAEITSELGAKSMGSHLGILSVKDAKDRDRKTHVFEENVRAWAEISDYAKSLGLEYLTWEPMSVAREQGETIEEARRIHEILNKAASIPIKFCLDPDHGLLTSPNPEDTDPYAWIHAFGVNSPIIHIKQSTGPKGGPFSFTKAFNEKGRIIPEKVIAAVKESGNDDCLLTLELSGPGREPWESNLMRDIKESVDYWLPHVDK